MNRRLPRYCKPWKKVLSSRFIVAIILFFISLFIFFFLFNTFIVKGNTAPFTIQQFYISKNNGIPNLYIKLKNNTFRNQYLYAYLRLDDKLNKLKKQVEIGDLGNVAAGLEKEYVLTWDNNWEGSGMGNIDLVVKNQEGIIVDQSIYIAVVPTSVFSVEMFTFLASGLIGSGLIISRFT